MRSPRRRWIVGRDLCLYRCEDFDNVPRGRRRAALELNIPVWSPFARTGHHCVWAGAAAMVWMWDAEQVGQSGTQGRREEEAPHGRPASRAAQWLPKRCCTPRRRTACICKPASGVSSSNTGEAACCARRTGNSPSRIKPHGIGSLGGWTRQRNKPRQPHLRRSSPRRRGPRRSRPAIGCAPASGSWSRAVSRCSPWRCVGKRRASGRLRRAPRRPRRMCAKGRTNSSRCCAPATRCAACAFAMARWRRCFPRRRSRN